MKMEKSVENTVRMNYIAMLLKRRSDDLLYELGSEIALTSFSYYPGILSNFHNSFLQGFW